MGAKANHHFVPQFYLRGFAVGVGRKARVFVFDSQSKTTFQTLVRNVASKRYFNRIEVDGMDPNVLEDWLAEIESLFAGHLSDVIAAKAFPTQDHFNSMMNLMAMLSIRNPRLRSQLENFVIDAEDRKMKLALSKKQFWDNQTARMKEKGLIENDDLTYDEIKSFYESRDFEISINQNLLIRHEMKMIEPVLSCLLKRNWCFACAPTGLQYICSDDPVVLSWTSEESAMIFYPPGHGMKGTMVVFPLSSELILIGQFESLPDQTIHSVTQMAATNTHIARYSTKQIYARDGSFFINLLNRDNVRGEDLPKLYGREA